MAAPKFRHKGAVWLDAKHVSPVPSRPELLVPRPPLCRRKALAFPDLPERFPTGAIFNLPQEPKLQVIWTNGMVCANL
jgi:hypothetical protein